MKYLLKFEEPCAAKIERSGGKGANLALLAQGGFPVPTGFIVTAQAYRDFIGTSGGLFACVGNLAFHEPPPHPVPLPLRGGEGARRAGEGTARFMRCDQTPKVQGASHDPGRLRIESERLYAALSKLPLPEALADEVRSMLQGYPVEQTFSVRSSSTMEDLASAAFAGQHESYLNCSGPDQILEKIKACFLSLWSARAMAYRQQQHFHHQQAEMAVVVQQMVQCEAAGVGFSIDPVTGDPGQMVVDANFGLGESVVSGEGEVDHFEIDKDARTLRRSHIARKTRRVVCVADGTKEVKVADDEAMEPSLSGEQIAQLAALLIRVEQYFRFPQDIEWGFAGGRLYLLQSRPVTTIPPRWTRDESAERFPNVITPLTWDFVESGFHRSLSHSFRLMGFPPFNGKWFGMHGHYIYGNQNAVELYLKRPPFSVKSLADLKMLIPRLREQYRWVQELPVLWSRDLDYYLLKVGEFMAEPLDQRDLAGVWAFVLNVNERGAQYFLPNIAISITHATLYRLLHGLLTMMLGPHDAHRLFDGLMAYCETKTGVINRELFELAQQVRALPELEQRFAEIDSRSLVEQRALAGFPEFNARFQKFLRDHGHREVDFDAYQPTWIEVPWVVLDNLRLILQTPMDRTPSQKERELKVRMQQSEFELFSKLPQDLHYFFYEILRLARVYTSLDDLEHYQTTRLTLPLRKGLRELGQRLVNRGILEEPMDIFFAQWNQIDEAVKADDDARWRELGELVRRQKIAYQSDRARVPEWVLGEDRKEDESVGDYLTGLAGGAGEAEGEVFVVSSPDDFAKFPKGSVLVARTTNPTWTPLFYSAVAVVTESGGPLSHGAVTAREMKIPAVMSVRGSLTRLKNGQKVKVDGALGRVYLL